MRVTCFLLASFVVLLSSSCGDLDAWGPSGPDPQPDYDYFPFAVGNSWTAIRTGSGSTGGEEYTVTGVSFVTVDSILAHTGGFDVFEVVTTGADTLHFKSEDVPQDPYISVEYVRETDTFIEAYPDPESIKILWTIPVPLAVGDTWLYTSRPVDTFAKVLSITETLETGAGSFEDVLLIELLSQPSPGVTDSVECYFAPEVGFIAREHTLNVLESGDWSDIVDELESYNIE